MFRNYYTVAFRYLLRHRTYSLLNIAGLAVGIATALLILLWVNQETGYDRFHDKYRNIYRVLVNFRLENGQISTYETIPMPAAAALKTEIPEIKRATRTNNTSRLFSYGDIHLEESGMYVDPDFLDIFSFPLVRGQQATALSEPFSVLITERLAKKYFGNGEPIGKQLRINREHDYKVVGVLKDVPSNSTLRFDFLMPMQDFIRQAQHGQESSWGDFNILTYVLLQGEAPAARVNAKIKNFVGKHYEKYNNTALFLHAAPDWYLRTDFEDGEYAGGGRITYVRLFMGVAAFILLIACINFMNLATARATQRAKEVGLRKAIGARKGALVTQFLTESLLLTLLAGVLAIILVLLVLPLVNSLLDKQLALPWTDPLYLLLFLAVLLFTGVMAGIYPAFVLSAFQPVKVLKGLREPSMGGIGWMRRSLVVVQFALSILLIVATLVVHRQVKFMQGKQLGYQKENLVWFPANGLSQRQYERSNALFSGIAGVKSVGLANTTLQGAWERTEEFAWPGMVKTDQTMFAKVPVDYNLLPTLGLKLVAGRNFSRSFVTDTVNLIINEEAARRMKLKNPVGQQVAYGENYAKKGTIIGVVKDFHLASAHAPIEPTIMVCRPQNTGIFFARLDGANTPATLKGIEATYRQLLPGSPFTFRFVDEQYEQMYRGEQQVGKLANAFAALAVLISCLGVFGLATFSIERRTKELGIRKILGASSTHLFSLVCRELMVLVGVGLLLALLPSWYLMQDWLKSFAYRFPIGWEVFALAGGIALLIALLTVSTQAIRAARANPVNSLRAD